MEPLRSRDCSQRLHLPHCHPVKATDKPGITWRQQIIEVFRDMDLDSAPWSGWAFIYTFVLFFFSASRCIVLKSLVEMYGSPQDYTSRFKLAALSLGFLEDFVCVTYFTCVLWLVDSLRNVTIRRLNRRIGPNIIRTVRSIATFTVSWILAVLMMIPFFADLVLVVNRDMRFSFDLVAAVIRERHHLKAAPITDDEIQRGYLTAVLVLLLATVFATVRTRSSWSDLTRWNPTQVVAMAIASQWAKTRAAKSVRYVELPVEEGANWSKTQSQTQDETVDNLLVVTTTNPGTDRKLACRHGMQLAVMFTTLFVVPAIVVGVRCICKPLVAYSALNATLNEFLRHALEPTASEPIFTNLKSSKPWVEQFIHPTEQYILLGDDSFYRRTTGFLGDKSFDIKIAKENPPNVLIIAVESFRFQDSHYLVGDADPSNRFKGTNLTITPNFDKWAKRGVAFRNLWSSNPTSRSLESMQFAQTPYYSPVKTGITGGRKNTTLWGLPQLFKAKGYETMFTTGSTTSLDGWDVFLPAHGFDSVWNDENFTRLAESELGVAHEQWYGTEQRGFRWGVQDDLSFQILGDLLVNKTKEQGKRMARGETKKPSFVTHYTISSHSPFKERPTWYAEAAKPNFSALYKGHKSANLIKNYLEMRYFTDMELGKFMDRMDNAGVLNDTIVLIAGDHGQAPESAVIYTDEVSMTRVPCAVIAEGRLGKDVGVVIEDAAEHYDFLNTLADIAGVPEEGFLQHGIGRSLKRKVSFGDRAVFSNVPGYKMSIVRGYQRLRYDAVTDWIKLHDIESDHDMATDLFPALSVEDKAEWLSWRDKGRRISAYYTKRWDDNCLAAVNCSSDT